MHSESPLVSVCVPAYNCEKYIGAAIRSVLAQTFPSFELVVVDNASTDSTHAVAASFDDRRIVLLRNESNIGLAGNWNRALDAARGKYFKLLPADDLLYPDCLEKQVAVMEAHARRGVSFTFCNRDLIGADGSTLRSIRKWRARGVVKAHSLVMKNVVSGMNVIGEPACVLVDTGIARTAGGFGRDNAFMIDLSFYTRALAHGDAYVVPEALCAFRIHDASYSVVHAKLQGEGFSRYIDEVVAGGAFPVPAHAVAVGKCMSYVGAGVRQLYYRLFMGKRG